jgi:hypothetical protein
MSELRNNLDRAKAEYQTLRYPGDLAGDVLPRAARRIWPMMATFAAIAVAAVVALALWLNAPARAPHQLSVKSPIKTPATPKVVTKKANAENTTDYESFPDGVTVVPTLDSMGLSQIPSMPSMDEMMSSSTATTQEAS